MFPDRFDAKIDVKPNGCHEWTAAHDPGGRPRFYYEGKNRRAHRVAYRLYTGRDIDGKVVRHRCDNPSCVNPKHLDLGTQADNVADRDRRQRTARGEAKRKSDLTEEDVVDIRKRYDRGDDSMCEIAYDYGVTRPTISDIVNGKIWMHVGGPLKS